MVNLEVSQEVSRRDDLPHMSEGQTPQGRGLEIEDVARIVPGERPVDGW